MKLSIIIINYKTPQLTIDCINSIKRYETDTNYEIIVLDNHSQDNSLAQIKKAHPSIIALKSDKNLGFAGGNNLAVSHATSEYLLFLNSDTYLTKPFLNKLIAFYESKTDAGMIGPRIRNRDQSVQTSVFKFPSLRHVLCECLFLCTLFPNNPHVGDYRNFNYFQTGPVDFVSGACFLIKHTLFKEANGFDARFFMYVEESDLAYRLHQKGYRHYFWADGDIVHLGGASSGISTRFCPMFFESKLKFIEKHAKKIGLRIYIILALMNLCIKNIIWLPMGRMEKIKFNNQIIKTYAKRFI